MEVTSQAPDTFFMRPARQLAPQEHCVGPALPDSRRGRTGCSMSPSASAHMAATSPGAAAAAAAPGAAASAARTWARSSPAQTPPDAAACAGVSGRASPAPRASPASSGRGGACAPARGAVPHGRSPSPGARAPAAPLRSSGASSLAPAAAPPPLHAPSASPSSRTASARHRSSALSAGAPVAAKRRTLPVATRAHVHITLALPARGTAHQRCSLGRLRRRKGLTSRLPPMRIYNLPVHCQRKAALRSAVRMYACDLQRTTQGLRLPRMRAHSPRMPSLPVHLRRGRPRVDGKESLRERLACTLRCRPRACCSACQSCAQPRACTAVTSGRAGP